MDMVKSPHSIFSLNLYLFVIKKQNKNLMCLTIRKQKTKFLKKSKTVYKHVLIEEYNQKRPEKSKLRTYYQAFKVKVGKTYYVPNLGIFSTLNSKRWSVTEGFHTFPTALLAVIDAIDVLPFTGTRIATGGNHLMGIVKCTVPAEAEFVEGHFSDFPACASNELKIEELIATISRTEGKPLVTILGKDDSIPTMMGGIYSMTDVFNG
jgi:hypothetical protein